MNMTETNIPQAGQWWEHVSGIRLLAVSREKPWKPGWVWALFAMDKPPVQVLDQWEGWKHLPDCTGFDWVPEKPIPEQVPVRLWCRYERGNKIGHMYVFANTEPPTGAGIKYSEIHSDGNGGWFVEVTK